MHGGPTTLVSSRCTSGRKTGSRLTSQDARRTNDFSVFKVYIWQKDRISPASQDARRTNYFSVFNVYIWQKDRISSHFTRCTEDQRLYCLQVYSGRKTGSRLTSQVARRANDCSVFKVYIWQKDRISSHFPRCTEDQRFSVFKVYIWQKDRSLLTSQDARRTNVFSVFKGYLAKRRDLVSLYKMHGGPTTLVSSRYTVAKRRELSHFTRCMEDQCL